MTTTEPDALADVVDLDLEHLTPLERAARARDAWRASGGGLSADQLAARFDRSSRWGRQQIAAARQEDAAAPAATAPDPLPPALPAPEPGSHDTASGNQAAAGRQEVAATPAPGGDRWWDRWALAAGRLGVLAVAAALSYSHMRAVVLDAGGEEWQAALWPLSVDGLLVVALVTLQRARRDGGSTAAAWAALVAALAASLAANVASAEPTLAGGLIAAWPPLALLAVEVLGRPKGGHHR